MPVRGDMLRTKTKGKSLQGYPLQSQNMQFFSQGESQCEKSQRDSAEGHSHRRGGTGEGGDGGAAGGADALVLG